MNQKQSLIWLIVIAAFAFFIYYFVPSPNNEIRQHDEFDGNFTSRHLVIKSGNFFNPDPNAVVHGSMNGLPRAVFVRYTESVALSMYLFGSLTGYAVVFVLFRMLAFLGMYLYGKDYIKYAKEQPEIFLILCLCFACLPYNTSYGLSICGIPLVFWAILNIKNGIKLKRSFSTLILFALGSNLVLSGVHLCFLFGIMLVWFWFKDRKFNYRILMAIFLTSTVYVLSEYMMFYNHLFNKTYHSSRSGFERELGLNIKGVIGVTFKNIFDGEFNTANYLGILFIPFFAYYGYVVFNRKDVPESGMSLMLFLLMFCGFMAALLDWSQMSFFYKSFPLANVFNFKRFISLVPGLFFIVLLAVLSYLVFISGKVNKMMTIISLIVFFTFIWRGNIARNRSSFECNGVSIDADAPNTFSQFFNTDIYRQIKQEIGKDTIGNVINYCLMPSACKYSGINVLDDYQGDYPLEYKKQFRKIIENEIEKSEEIKSVFDEWGSKCYLYSKRSITGNFENKNGFAFDPDLDINTDQIKKMNGSYILSGVIIGNAKILNLQVQKVFVSPLNFQHFILYKII